MSWARHTLVTHKGSAPRATRIVSFFWLGFFFDQLLAVGSLVGRDYFIGEFVGHVVVVGKFHGIGGATLRLGYEVVGVSEHFRKRNLRFDDYVVAAHFAAGD